MMSVDVAAPMMKLPHQNNLMVNLEVKSAINNLSFDSDSEEPADKTNMNLANLPPCDCAEATELEEKVKNIEIKTSVSDSGSDNGSNKGDDGSRGYDGCQRDSDDGDDGSHSDDGCHGDSGSHDDSGVRGDFSTSNSMKRSNRGPEEIECDEEGGSSENCGEEDGLVASLGGLSLEDQLFKVQVHEVGPEQQSLQKIMSHLRQNCNPPIQNENPHRIVGPIQALGPEKGLPTMYCNESELQCASEWDSVINDALKVTPGKRGRDEGSGMPVKYSYPEAQSYGPYSPPQMVPGNVMQGLNPAQPEQYTGLESNLDLVGDDFLALGVDYELTSMTIDRAPTQSDSTEMRSFIKHLNLDQISGGLEEPPSGMKMKMLPPAESGNSEEMIHNTLNDLKSLHQPSSTRQQPHVTMTSGSPSSVSQASTAANPCHVSQAAPSNVPIPTMVDEQRIESPGPNELGLYSPTHILPTQTEAHVSGQNVAPMPFSQPYRSAPMPMPQTPRMASRPLSKQPSQLTLSDVMESIKQQRTFTQPQLPMGPPYQSLRSPQYQIGSPPQPMGSPQQPIGSPQQPMRSPQQPMGSPPRSVGSPQQPIRSPQQPMGSQQQPMGSPQQPMGLPQQPMRSPQQPMRSPLQPIGSPQQPMRSPQQPIGSPQQPISEPQYTIPQPSVSPALQHYRFQMANGSPQQPIPSPHQPVPSPQQPIGSPQQPIGSPLQPTSEQQYMIQPQYGFPIAYGSPQQPIGSPQQPVPSPQQPVPSPQQPVPSPQQPMGPLQLPIGSPQSHYIPTPQSVPSPLQDYNCPAQLPSSTGQNPIPSPIYRSPSWNSMPGSQQSFNNNSQQGSPPQHQNGSPPLSMESQQAGLYTLRSSPPPTIQTSQAPSTCSDHSPLSSSPNSPGDKFSSYPLTPDTGYDTSDFDDVLKILMDDTEQSAPVVGRQLDDLEGDHVDHVRQIKEGLIASSQPLKQVSPQYLPQDVSRMAPQETSGIYAPVGTTPSQRQIVHATRHPANLHPQQQHHPQQLLLTQQQQQQHQQLQQQKLQQQQQQQHHQHLTQQHLNLQQQQQYQQQQQLNLQQQQQKQSTKKVNKQKSIRTTSKRPVPIAPKNPIPVQIFQPVMVSVVTTAAPVYPQHPTTDSTSVGQPPVNQPILSKKPAATSSHEDEVRACIQVAKLSLEELQHEDAGDTLLNIAVSRENQFCLVKALLRRYERENMLADIINKGDENKVTPVIIATLNNKPATVRELVQAGADVNVQARFTNRPGNQSEFRGALHLAAGKGSKYSQTLYELLQAPNVDVNLANTQGESPLHCAVLKHHKDRIDSRPNIHLLLEKNANCNQKQPCSEKTPFHCAIEKNDLSLVEFLLTELHHIAPATIPSIINTQCHDGNTTLHLAAGLQMHDDPASPRSIARLLLQNGADPLQANNCRKCPKNLTTDPEMLALLKSSSTERY